MYNPKIQEGYDFTRWLIEKYSEDLERVRYTSVPVIDTKGKVIYLKDGITPYQIAPRIEVLFRS